jgi:K+ transporter
MIGRGPGHPRHDAAARGQPSDETASWASRGSVAALTIAALEIVYADIGTSPLGSESKVARS